MDSNISQELLINVFIPNTPLHDGAMIIQGTKISQQQQVICHCLIVLRYLKVWVQDIELRLVFQKYLMHLPLLYLKETGDISVTFDGKLRRDISKRNF